MLALDFEDGGISGDCNGDSLAINDGEKEILINLNLNEKFQQYLCNCPKTLQMSSIIIHTYT